MNFKCCPFKLKKDQLSSYYLSAGGEGGGDGIQPTSAFLSNAASVEREKEVVALTAAAIGGSAAAAAAAATVTSTGVATTNSSKYVQGGGGDSENGEAGAALLSTSAHYETTMIGDIVGSGESLDNVDSKQIDAHLKINEANNKRHRLKLNKKRQSTNDASLERGLFGAKPSAIGIGINELDENGLDSTAAKQATTGHHNNHNNKFKKYSLQEQSLPSLATTPSSITAAAAAVAALGGSEAVSEKPQATYYELNIYLKEGKKLAIRDIGGSSDPYAKFTLNGVSVFKSKIVFKNLNPIWSERFSVKLLPFAAQSKQQQQQQPQQQSPLSPDSSVGAVADQLEAYLAKYKLKVVVYDYDRGFLADDLIGYANIDLSTLKESTPVALELELEDDSLDKSEYLGMIFMDVTLVPKYDLNEGDNATLATVAKLATSTSTQLKKKSAYQPWQSVLNIVLIEANDLLSLDGSGAASPFVKFKLDNERYRTKTIRRTLNPKFLEQFQFYAHDLNKITLSITVHDNDISASNSEDLIGRASVDLKLYEVERTHFIKVPLEDGAGTVSLLFTITGIYMAESPLNDNNADSSSKLSEVDSESFFREDLIKRYGLLRSFANLDDIGCLQVKVIRAEGLASADLNGKSDPLCAIQLINQYVQTHTEYKTLNPEWGKVFEFNVTDIHAVLEIVVLDEDKNKVYEFLGKIEIPILNIESGKRKLYALKDKKLIKRAKGCIELEMNFIYNPLKAVIKTFNPAEKKYIIPESKLKIPVLQHNIARVHNLAQGLINTGNFIKSCFKWVDPVRSIVSFTAFIVVVLTFEAYMFPLMFIMIFLKNYIAIKMKPHITTDDDESNFEYYDEEEEAAADAESKEPKKTFREKLTDIQEICLKVQDKLDEIASLGERVINTFNFTTPWLSTLAIVVLLIASFILYLIPLRYLILMWGINKFTKKFRKPANYVDNTEILDFLSRVPSNKQLFHYRELRLDKNTLNSSSGATNLVSSASPKEKKKKKN